MGVDFKKPAAVFSKLRKQFQEKSHLFVTALTLVQESKKLRSYSTAVWWFNRTKNFVPKIGPARDGRVASMRQLDTDWTVWLDGVAKTRRPSRGRPSQIYMITIIKYKYIYISIFNLIKIKLLTNFRTI